MPPKRHCYDPLYQRGLRLCVFVYKGLYIRLLKNMYCISYYTAIIADVLLLVNYFVYHIEIHLVVTLLGTSPFRIPANAFQYGVLSSFPSNWRSSHSPSSIVGLMRLCLGSIVTSNDLPPDLHSNHIETHYPTQGWYPLPRAGCRNVFQYDCSYRPKPPTACNCSPISRQSAPVVRQRSSSA
jgi:hypothetical protein